MERVRLSPPCAFSNKNNRVGAWRSLVAHLHGVQGVPSSNLGAPTNTYEGLVI